MGTADNSGVPFDFQHLSEAAPSDPAGYIAYGRNLPSTLIDKAIATPNRSVNRPNFVTVQVMVFDKSG